MTTASLTDSYLELQVNNLEQQDKTKIPHHHQLFEHITYYIYYIYSNLFFGLILYLHIARFQNQVPK